MNSDVEKSEQIISGVMDQIKMAVNRYLHSHYVRNGN